MHIVNPITSICCGFVVVQQQIHNKSKKMSLGLTISRDSSCTLLRCQRTFWW